MFCFKKIIMISLLLSTYTSQSFGSSCANLLSKSNDFTLPRIDTKEAYREASALVDQYREDVELLRKATESTLPLKLAYFRNQRLRESSGGYSSALDGQRLQQIINLSSALKDLDNIRVRHTVKRVMLDTEMHTLKISALRKKIAILVEQRNNAQRVFLINFFRKDLLSRKINKERKKLNAQLKKLYKLYPQYRALRETFEEAIEHGDSQLERDFAKEAFANTGVSQPDFNLSLPDSSDLTDGRPSLELVTDEYLGRDFIDGTPRPLGKESLLRIVRAENQQLRILNLKKGIVFEFLLEAIGVASRFAHTKSWGAKITPLLDWMLKDMLNREALRVHLAEIHSIELVPGHRRLNHFKKILANFTNRGQVRTSGFDFLTSFARSIEHEETWARVKYSLALRHVDQLSLIDPLFDAERKLTIQKAERDYLKHDLHEARGDSELTDLISARIDALTVQIGKTENEHSAIYGLLNEALLKFQKMTPESNPERTNLHEDQQIYKEMVAAAERAAKMKALSYEYLPSFQPILRTTSVVIVLAGLRALLINTPGIELLDALFERFGFEAGIPELETLWGQTLEKISAPTERPDL